MISGRVNIVASILAVWATVYQGVAGVWAFCCCWPANEACHCLLRSAEPSQSSCCRTIRSRNSPVSATLRAAETPGSTCCLPERAEWAGAMALRAVEPSASSCCGQVEGLHEPPDLGPLHPMSGPCACTLDPVSGDQAIWQSQRALLPKFAAATVAPSILSAAVPYRGMAVTPAHDFWVFPGPSLQSLYCVWRE